MMLALLWDSSVANGSQVSNFRRVHKSELSQGPGEGGNQNLSDYTSFARGDKVCPRVTVQLHDLDTIQYLGAHST